jgi:hypothetical protein
MFAQSLSARFALPLPRPPWSVFNINHRTAAPRHEFLRVFLFSEAANIEPLVVAVKRMSARRKRSTLAEFAQRSIATGGFRRWPIDCR